MSAESRAGEITELLRRAGAGDAGAEEILIERVYGDLHRLAAIHLRRERSGHTLQPTELVGKVFIRLCRDVRVDYQDRAHFFRMAATGMRRILVDHARTRRASKRGGGINIPFDDVVPSPPMQIELILDVDQALLRLEDFDDRLAQIVTMRFFGGLSEEEIGAALGVAPRTIRREWKTAKAWLRGELTARSMNDA